MADTKRTSKCMCGEVEMELVGQPMASVNCHCTVCQNWSGAPFQWMVLFPTDKATVVKGADNIQIGKTSETLSRGRCKKCTCHVHNLVPGKLCAVPGVAIQDIRSEDRTFTEGFAPAAEIFYGTRVKDMNGDLPTFDGFPPM